MNNKLFFCLTIGLLILPASCGTPAPSPDFEPSVIVNAPPTLSATSTRPIQITVTEMVPQLPVATPNSQPALTLTPTHSPEPPTPIPTLPEATAQARIADLLNTNANCRLPCWWGITPGLSNWIEAFQILDPLGGTRKHLPTGWEYLFSNHENGIFTSQHLILEGDIVKMIEILFGGTYFLSMPEILTEYGPPSEVYIRTFSNEHKGIIPFYLILFYADQGILARFESNDASLTATTVQMCFRQDPVWGMVLWPPSDQQTYWEVAEIATTVGMGGSEDDHLPVLSIEDVTDLNPNSFYSAFKDSNNPSCLETPVEFWPGQFQ